MVDMPENTTNQYRLTFIPPLSFLSRSFLFVSYFLSLFTCFFYPSSLTPHIIFFFFLYHTFPRVLVRKETCLFWGCNPALKSFCYRDFLTTRGVVECIIIMSRHQHRCPWPSSATLLYRPSLLVDPQSHIPYQHRVVVCGF